MSLEIPSTQRSTADRAATVRRELVVVPLALAGYFGLRLVIEGDRATAVRNAERLLDLEQRLGIDIERDLQGWVLDHDVVRWALSAGYIWLHWPLLIAAMVYLTGRAPAVQARLRNAIIVSAAVGIVLFSVVPMAPPRFMPGFVGTVSDAARRHFLPYPLDWTNQFAAFPSYHVGWTLIACVAVAGVVRARWMRVAVAAPAVVVAVAVVGTGNHYVLDSLAGAVLALAAWWSVAPRSIASDTQHDAATGAVGSAAWEPYWVDDRAHRGAASDLGDAEGDLRCGARSARPRRDRRLRHVDVRHR